MSIELHHEIAEEKIAEANAINFLDKAFENLHHAVSNQLNSGMTQFSMAEKRELITEAQQLTCTSMELIHWAIKSLEDQLE